MNSYQQFLASKRIAAPETGFDVAASDLNERMFAWQRVVAKWSLRRGRAGIFLDTGLGKTFQQLVVADHVVRHTGGRFLLLCPLAVSRQTLMEASRFGITCPVNVTHFGGEEFLQPGITITNYEKLHKFNPKDFVGVGLDEGSILKSLDGKTRNTLIDSFQQTPYRYVFTATPSPNDLTEIGSYAEFLGIMSRSEMLAMFFTHDGGDTSKWRLRGHAEQEFFRWMATWAVMLRTPADIGFPMDGYDLPELKIYEHIIADKHIPKGHLFQIEAKTLGEQRESRRNTIEDRVNFLANTVNNSPEPWVVWCNLNAESEAATAAIPGAVQITGAMKDYEKEQRLIEFSEGKRRMIVTKPSIAGFGLNWQHCHNMAFLGLSHSYEEFYQAIRRCYRFGQTKPVNVHVIVSDRDGSVVASIKRKQAEADRLTAGMVSAMAMFSRNEFRSARRETAEYQPTQKMDLSLWQPQQR